MTKTKKIELKDGVNKNQIIPNVKKCLKNVVKNVF